MKERSVVARLPQAFILIGLLMVLLAMMAVHFGETVVNRGFTSSEQSAKLFTQTMFARNKPPKPPPYASSDTTAPPAPTNVSASATRRKINVSWNGSSDEAGGSGTAGYELWRRKGAESSARLAVTSASSLGYSDTAVTKGSTYCYAVKAFDRAGNVSAPSDESCATP